MGDQMDQYQQIAYDNAPQQGEDVNDVHPSQGDMLFIDNTFYTDIRAVNPPLNEGSFGQQLQTAPYSRIDTNDGLLRDVYGMQVHTLDIEVPAKPWSLGLGGEQNEQVQVSLISADIVSQSSSSSEYMSASNQMFVEPLFAWGNSGETILSTSSFPPDLSRVDGAFNFVDGENAILPLSETGFIGLNGHSGHICFDNFGWCSGAIKPPPPIAPKPRAPTPSDVTQTVPSPHSSSYQTPSSVSKRKRSQFDDEGRIKVKNVRRRGACLRCKIYKLSCDEEIPCMNCLKVKDKQKVFRGPCIRPNISDVQSFRAGDGDNGQLRSILPEYKWLQGGQTMTVKLQWPFRRAHANTPIIEVACQMFKPIRGQNTAEEFQINNKVHKVELPPWACRDTESVRKSIGRFLGECQELLEEEIRVTLKDDIMRLTWSEALRYRATHKSTLITRALQVFAGAMMNSRYPMSLKTNVFGVPDELDTPYFFDKLPLPAQLTYQIQTMIAHEMLDTQTLLLRELKSRIFHKNRQRHWYEAYLTVFTLLATIEFVYRTQMHFVRAKAGISDRNLTNIAFVTQAMLDEWESSARNLINHFRCVMNGEVPFNQSWEEGSDNPRRAGLDARAVDYICAIKRETGARQDELRALRELESRLRFEKPLGAICELFLPSEA